MLDLGKSENIYYGECLSLIQGGNRKLLTLHPFFEVCILEKVNQVLIKGW